MPHGGIGVNHAITLGMVHNDGLGGAIEYRPVHFGHDISAKPVEHGLRYRLPSAADVAFMPSRDESVKMIP